MARQSRREKRYLYQSEPPSCSRRSSRLRGLAAIDHSNQSESLPGFAAIKHSDHSESLSGLPATDHVNAHSRLDLSLHSSSDREEQVTLNKRKRGDSGESRRRDDCPKRKRIAQERAASREASPLNPVAHWVTTFSWPELPNSRGAMAMTMSSSSKRKSSSTHHSVRRERLEKNKIFLDLSVSLQTESLELCSDLLEGDRRPEDRPSYPLNRTSDVLRRVSGMNEARLQRDVTSWLVPSAENLFFSGDTQLHYVGEEIQAEWVRCGAMGSTRPKPDFAVGLRRTAFEDGELDKLENYATPGTPFLFTPNLAFPFLICELKTGQEGMGKAELQNIHSGSIAVRALLSLYHAAYGKNHAKARGLLGRILVFSVYHNDQQINIYGHYAVANDSSNGHDDALENLRYSRHGIALFSLTIGQGKDRFKSHNFIRNLYDKFAPEHLKRIKDAVGHLPSVQPRTGSSFATSDLAMDHESGSQQGSEVSDVQEGSGFRTPGAPASAYLIDEISKMREQMRELVKQLEQQRRDSQEQLEQQKKDSQERLEQQKKDSQELLVRLFGRPAAAV